MQTASFAVHATRGVIRDPRLRRQIMLGLLATAVVLLICGSTFLAPILNVREHRVWFVVFWAICGWLTISAMLVAVFDLLRVGVEGRRQQRRLRQGVETDSQMPGHRAK